MATEARVLGLETLDKQIANRQKLTSIRRVANEKLLARELQLLERTSLNEMHLNDHLERQLKDELFHIRIKTKNIEEQKGVVDRFLNEIQHHENMRRERKNKGLFAEETMVSTPPGQGEDDGPIFGTIKGVSGTVSETYSDKRLKIILPKLLKHREQLLQSTLLKVDNDKSKQQSLTERKKALLKRRANKVGRNEAKVIEIQKSREPTDLDSSPISTAHEIAKTKQKTTTSHHNAEQKSKHHDAKSADSRSRDGGGKINTSRGEQFRTVTVAKAGGVGAKQQHSETQNIFDAMNLEIDNEEKARIDRLNMLRMLAGMNRMEAPAAGTMWNRHRPSVMVPIKPKPDPIPIAIEEDEREKTPGCPALRDPLPCEMPKLKLKRKEKHRLTKTVPLASRLLLGRFRIQNKKIEETYLSNWKDRVIIEDKFRLADLRRRQAEEEEAKALGGRKSTFAGLQPSKSLLFIQRKAALMEEQLKATETQQRNQTSEDSSLGNSTPASPVEVPENETEETSVETQIAVGEIETAVQVGDAKPEMIDKNV